MTLELIRVHPDRLNKPECLKGFLFRESPLRRNQSWAEWLDRLHPTMEHVMFGDAAMGAYATSITVGTAFAAKYIRMNFSDNLLAHFGATVAVGHAGQRRK